MSDATRPLEGFRVLDLTVFWAGPLPSAILADLGAEVIKVEAPHRLDPFRAYGIPGTSRDAQAFEKSPLFNSANRNKRGITLNLADQRGQELFKRLVSKSDAVMENFTPRVLPQFGLGYEVLRAIKPALVMTSISGFGRSGPWRDYVSFAAIGEALSGISSLTGYDSRDVLLHGVGVSDPYTGLTAAFATLAALQSALETGEGRHIEIAQLEASLPFIADAIMEYVLNNTVRGRVTNEQAGRAPHGAFRARGDDVWVTISVGTDLQWQGLLDAMGQPAWGGEERFATPLARYRNRAALNALVEEWTSSRDKEALASDLQRRGVPAAPVRSPAEQINDPQLKSLGFFQMVDHPYAGRHPYPSFPARFSGRYPAIARVGPLAGQDNRFVFEELLGLSRTEIEELEAAGITGPPAL